MRVSVHTDEGAVELVQAYVEALEEGELLELQIFTSGHDLNALSDVLSPANRIGDLTWRHYRGHDVIPIIPLLQALPDLHSLALDFRYHSALDFLTQALPLLPNLRKLHMPEHEHGNLAGFFSALSRSGVTSLSVYLTAPLIAPLNSYLSEDKLLELTLILQCPMEGLTLTNCRSLTTLTLIDWDMRLERLPGLPRSVRLLEVRQGFGRADIDWSSLADSGVRELKAHRVLVYMSLAMVLSRGAPLDSIWSDQNLAELLSVEYLAGVTKLSLVGVLSGDAIGKIARALETPGNALRHLELAYNNDTADSIKAYLTQALRMPSCALAKLRFVAWGHEAEAKKLEDVFQKRVALVALLQGQQVRRQQLNPLRRLPIEMFRLVGMTLM